MRRLTIPAVGVLLLLGATAPPSVAGDEPNPNWFNDPTSGPSPNTDHVVGNRDDGECRGFLKKLGISLLGGDPAPASVQVRLEIPGEDVSREYTPDAEGHWGESRGAGQGTFDIPGGLAPGTYPLHARCILGPSPLEAMAFGPAPVVLGGLPGFTYADRTYTVVAESDEADPVETVVTFTG